VKGGWLAKLPVAGAIFYAERFSRQPYHTSILTGHMWVHELLHGNPSALKINLGWRSMFLCSWSGSSPLLWKLFSHFPVGKVGDMMYRKIAPAPQDPT